MPSTSSTVEPDSSPAPTRVVIPAQGLDRLIQILHRQGRTVVGPVVRDGAIVNDVIDGADDLPWGVGDDQSPGRYRLVSRATPEAFGFANPAQSFKRYLHPPRSLLFTAVRHRDAAPGEVPVTIELAEPDPAELDGLALLGVRSCDLAAWDRLDRAMVPRSGHRPTPDPDRDRDLGDGAARPGPGGGLQPFVVAVACGHPSSTCFCASMETGPVPGRGYDLALTELVDDGPHEFLVDIATDAGRSVAAELASRPADAVDQRRAAAATERATRQMGRRLDPRDPPAAADRLDHPRWRAVGDRCLACANCTLVCPTCFCSTTEDVTRLADQPVAATGVERTERHLVWDSCFASSFSDLNGRPVRSATADRYRHWLLHKLVTWHDQFGTSGCVGCGRCITWCPVGIDLTEEVAALARPPIEEAS